MIASHVDVVVAKLREVNIPKYKVTTNLYSGTLRWETKAW